MVSINKSFLYGMCCASITWIISLYLYINLVNTETYNTLTPITQKQKNTVNYYRSNNLVATNDKDSSNDEKQLHLKNVFNSDKLLQNLQPVITRPKLTSGTFSELNEMGLVKTAEDQERKNEGYKLFAYNVLISDQLSYHRPIPDTRNKLCKNIAHNLTKLPAASIIICFYNEHYHTLLRTIHSILDRTPADLLHEILLIDDYSDSKLLHENVSIYLNQTLKNSKVKLFRMKQREGLIRARVFGSRKSTGDVLIFLDSHVEVNVGWIEPLLAQIAENRTNVAMPVIDIINADTFVYTSSPLVRGGFNWGLHFKWENLPKGTLSKSEDFTKPIKSPTMAGGLFAIAREYFKELGEYDEGMNIWGGENLEISFRIWMCGGNLALIPCSRIGHVFRQRRPYGSPTGQDTMLYNSLRVANVWMDDYKTYFLQHRTDGKHVDFGDISSRVALRRKLKCNDFDWYIKNVYPELTLPSDNEERLKKKWQALETDDFQPWHSRKRNYVDEFQLRLANTSLCVQSEQELKSAKKGGKLVLKRCTRIKSQMWYVSDRNEFVLGQLLCLQSGKLAPILYKCHEMGGDQEWKYGEGQSMPIYNIAAGLCLGVDAAQPGQGVVMKLCSESLIRWNVVR